MAPALESEQPIQSLKTVSNKQVELFDRLRQAEERIDAIMERLRKCEGRTEALESAMKRNPSRV
jgi:hypothetical protein